MLAPRGEASDVVGVTENRFITFEGGEGGGKSTQVRLLAHRLRITCPDVVLTREPGGSPGAESLRSLLVRGDADRWSAMTETLILFAARRDHIERVIAPALERNAWVVCDRFMDSTRAYQGAAGGVQADIISQLERAVIGSVLPDLTVILDIDPEEGLRRAGRRGDADTRFEGKGLAFHQCLREEFLSIAEREPDRCVVIDCSGSIDEIAEAVWLEVVSRLLPSIL